MKQIARATDMIEISLNERESGLFEAAEFAACVLAFREAYKVRVEDEVNVKAIVAVKDIRIRKKCTNIPTNALPKGTHS